MSRLRRRLLLLEGKSVTAAFLGETSWRAPQLVLRFRPRSISFFAGLDRRTVQRAQPSSSKSPSPTPHIFPRLPNTDSSPLETVTMSDIETSVESALNYALPEGHYTLLPLVESCDNFVLPVGPWTVRDCKARRVRYQEEAIERKLKDLKIETNGNGRHGSAVDDEDDEVDDVDPRKKTSAHVAAAPPTKTELDNEFLVPFFIDLPHDSSITGSSSLTSRIRSPSINGLSRRSSSSSLTRPAFKLTPLSPPLRPSSPSSAAPALPTLTNNDTPTTKPQPIGFLRPSIVMALMEDNVRMVEMSCKPVWAFLPPQIIPQPKSAASRRPSGNWTSRPSSRRNSHALNSPATTGTATPEVGEEHHTNGNGHGEMDRNRMRDVLEGMEAGGGNGSGVWAVGFEDHVNEEGIQSRREHLDRVVRGWKMSGMFPDQLGGQSSFLRRRAAADDCAGWRNESYNIYGPPAPIANDSPPLPGSNVAFTLERAACSLFGLCTFGVHLTAYVEDEGQPMKIWVPKRSATKQTFVLLPFRTQSWLTH